MSKSKDPRIELELKFKEREFYVFFTKGEHLFTPFLKKGFGHVFMIERLEFLWLMYDPSRYGFQVYVLPQNVDEDIVAQITEVEPTAKCLHLFVQARKQINYLKPRIHSCVTMIESCLGFYVGAKTPYSLYKKLLAAKLPEIKECIPCQI